jgi:ubiquilin
MSDLTLTIKCSNADKATLIIANNATVLELKEKIAEELNVPATQQRLIYKGRVLKDDLTLEHYEVQDGHTVHMVKGASASSGATASTATPVAAPQAEPIAAPTSQVNPFAMAANPFATGGMPDVNRMQELLMRNPEVMQQIMNSPMMDNLLNNPDLLRNTMLSNPQMQAMLDANPQVRHMLNDPAVSLSLHALASASPL